MKLRWLIPIAFLIPLRLSATDAPVGARVAYGRTAEVVRDYVNKGAQLFIQGKIQTCSWDDKESGQKRYRTEILVFDVTL
ncbi:MAG: single-stranded DNA-binding protein [Deltaproteobacteria bacterium]|nr:single-stranded DNA-binding protein [Deltaproteobacteria bacterium]